LSQDYNEAVQEPRTHFRDPELRDGRAVTGPLGLPVPRSGSFADVYQFHAAAGPARWAVKCFTRPVAGLRDRYREISAYLRRVKLPFFVEFEYLEEGVRVRSAWYPVVKMQWVEGLHLNDFVRDNLDRPAMLESLARLWVRLGRRLREAGLAHGDLQHGNVLLVPARREAALAVKLIDYDGLFVPALADSPPGEAGHPAYQHPQRLRDRAYGPEIDRFPLLVVATALRCLAAGGRALWDRHDNGDNLLFREADLKAPDGSRLFRELAQLGDPQARALVDRLAAACRLPLGEVPPLDDEDAQEYDVEPVAPPPARAAAAPPDVFAGLAEPEVGRPRRPRSDGLLPWAVAISGLAFAALMLALLVAVLVLGDGGQAAPPAATARGGP
jgi:hypothetical protein